MTRTSVGPPQLASFVQFRCETLRFWRVGSVVHPDVMIASGHIAAHRRFDRCKSALGHERRYRPRPPTVRCSTDSARIAAPLRTGAWGQKRWFHEDWKSQSFLIKKDSAEAKPLTKSMPVSKKGMPSAPQFSRRLRLKDRLISRYRRT